MKKKITIILIAAMLVFVFIPALTLAQDDLDNSQETIADETETTSDENDQDSEEKMPTEEDTDKNYQNLKELLADLEANEELSSVEKITLKRKLTEYDAGLEIDTISSIVDKILAEEIELGQGFVIMRNLTESVKNGFAEERALEMINNYQNKEKSGQFAFQTALELRKLSREDISGEKSEAFVDEVASIIEEKGEIETSELKQLAAEYRKEAREENREQMRADKSEKLNPASENALENRDTNKKAEKVVGKDNKEKGISKAKNNGKDKASNKSQNSNANANKNSKN